MDALEFAAWQEAAETVQRHARTYPCMDCTAEFAAEMRDIHACNGEPAPQLDDDMEIASVNMKLAAAQRRMERDARIVRAVALRREGLTMATIAKTIGIQVSTVSEYLTEHDPLGKGQAMWKARTVERVAMAAKLADEGLTRHHIAERMRCSVSSVSRYLWRAT
jgi:predicted transcriptional regulator